MKEAKFDMKKVGAMSIAGRRMTSFPGWVARGSVIRHPDNGEEYIVTKTPLECGSLSCEVKVPGTNKRLYQFAYVGLIVDGKPLKAID